MDWTTLIVGLGSILLGAFSTYLAFKDRTSSFQENIHTRQVEAIIKIFDIIQIPFLLAVTIVFFDFKENKKDTELEEFIKSFRNEIGGLFKEIVFGTQSDIILPTRLLEIKKNYL